MQLNKETKEKLKAFVAGKMTWAEVEGMTAAEACGIAQTACELASEGKLEQARVLLEGLVASNPLDAAARSALGTVFQKLGRIEEAMAEYDGALTMDPRNVVALANRGELKLRRNDESGYQDLVSAVQLDATGKTAAGKRAQSLLKAIALAAVRQSAQA